ncbi:MAG: efflux RND transporter permease subunit [Xanthomonadales bacterium]|nr:efflux RND transporter permease subunit [Xanthomonadales bacterium]
MSLLERLITHHPLANIAFAVVLVMGAIAYATMPREQDPEINFNWLNITTALPGASAEDVEAKITNPLEDALRNVQDVRWVISSSREGVSNILVRFREIDERTFDKRVNDVRREIQNKANAELPVEALDPDILEITSANGFPTAMVVLRGQADDEHLRFAARSVREDIERISGVDRVLALGFRDPELRVEFDPQALAARGVNAVQLADALRGWFRDVFAGKQDASDAEWLVRVAGAVPDVERLAGFELPLADGSPVRLDTLAEVRRVSQRPRQLVGTEGQPAVLMSITKIGGSNTLELVDRLREYVERKNAVLAGTGLSLVLSDDQSLPTRDALAIMQDNALVGLILVLGVCWLFLGSRISAMVALGVVFSIAGTFILLDITGNSLNVSVLLGIVIVLGMLVDDAVVVVEAMYYRMQRGTDALQAGLESLREVGLPVLAAVATTVAAFLPLMLLPGILGQFMFVIPFVVTVGLTVSLIEAVWMLPAHVVALGPKALSASRSQAWRERWTHALRVKYTRALIHVMRKPVPYLSGAFALFVAALLAILIGWKFNSGPVRFNFFAFDPIRLFYVNVDLPPTTPIEESIQHTLTVEQIVRRHLREGEARSVVSMAGIKFTPDEAVFGDRYGQIAVSLNPATEDARLIDEIIEAMREDVESAPVPAALSFLKLSGGPPTGKAISVKVRADDPAELAAAAERVKQIVKGIEGTRDISDDASPGRSELTLEVDVAAAREAGLDPAAVARLVRLHVDGEVVADLRDRGEKVELRVQARPQRLDRVEALLAQPVALPGGGSTVLGALVKAETRTSADLIKHWNFRRAITVEADLDLDVNNAVAAAQTLREHWETVRAAYPNTDLDFSGQLDDINESLAAMGPLGLLGIGLIYLILAAQFRSYWQPLLILVTVPLALVGVTLGVVVSGNPVSLYTLYGAIALIGISVNGAIVLIDAANSRRAAGMRTLHAAIYAARRRVIAIAMTTGTTIAGLFSLAMGFAGESLLWGPVASAIVWGLAFSSVLTLFVVPVLYRQFMKGLPPSRLHRRGVPA